MAIDDETGVPAKPGFSRRDLIKRGAVVGTVVWAAPVIDSFVSSASAAGSGVCGAVTICVYNQCTTCDPVAHIHSCPPAASGDYALSAVPALINGVCSPISFATICCSAGDCGASGFAPCGTPSVLTTVCPGGTIACQ